MIDAVGQWSTAARALAGEIEPAVGAHFDIGGDFGATIWASGNDNGQGCATVHTDFFVVQGKSAASRADNLSAVRTGT